MSFLERLRREKEVRDRREAQERDEGMARVDREWEQMRGNMKRSEEERVQAMRHLKDSGIVDMARQLVRLSDKDGINSIFTD